MINFKLDVNHYFHWGQESLILQRLDQIMATQADVAAQLTAQAATLAAQATQVAKIGTETDGLLQKIADLTVAVEQAGNATPEVEAALAAVNDQTLVLQSAITGVDDKVPDAVTP